MYPSKLFFIYIVQPYTHNLNIETDLLTAIHLVHYNNYSRIFLNVYLLCNDIFHIDIVLLVDEIYFIELKL